MLPSKASAGAWAGVRVRGRVLRGSVKWSRRGEAEVCGDRATAEGTKGFPRVTAESVRPERTWASPGG